MGQRVVRYDSGGERGGLRGDGEEISAQTQRRHWQASATQTLHSAHRRQFNRFKIRYLIVSQLSRHIYTCFLFYSHFCLWMSSFSCRITGVLPGFNDLTPQADLLCVFQQLQTQVDLPLDFFIRVDPRQVHPAIQSWDIETIFIKTLLQHLTEGTDKTQKIWMQIIWLFCFDPLIN